MTLFSAMVESQLTKQVPEQTQNNVGITWKEAAPSRWQRNAKHNQTWQRRWRSSRAAVLLYLCTWGELCPTPASHPSPSRRLWFRLPPWCSRGGSCRRPETPVCSRSPTGWHSWCCRGRNRPRVVFLRSKERRCVITRETFGLFNESRLNLINIILMVFIC